jgi:hypothetical protein
MTAPCCRLRHQQQSQRRHSCMSFQNCTAT